jgi:hypothetical protein
MKRMAVDKLNLCAIIAACAKGGVSELKFGGVEVKFFNASTPVHDPLPTAISAVPTWNDLPAAQDSRQPVVKNAHAFDRDLLEDLRMSQLLIDDPHGFEREIVNSHLRGEINEAIQN